LHTDEKDGKKEILASESSKERKWGKQTKSVNPTAKRRKKHSPWTPRTKLVGSPQRKKEGAKRSMKWKRNPRKKAMLRGQGHQMKAKRPARS